jgi:putative transposase
VVELALEVSELSPTELAHRMIDQKQFFNPDSSVYRIFKTRGLITSTAYLVIKTVDGFKDKTTRVNQL